MRPAGHAPIGQKIEVPVLRLDQDEPHAVVAIDARQLDRVSERVQVGVGRGVLSIASSLVQRGDGTLRNWNRTVGNMSDSWHN